MSNRVQAPVLAGILALVSATLLTQVPLASGNSDIALDAFIDAQLQVSDDQSNLNSNPGFVLNDGALMASIRRQGAYGLIDIPVAGKSLTNALRIATDRGQAFVGFKYESGIFWQIGQWDRLWGFENNDTKDLNYFKPSHQSEMLLPSTHAGFLAAIPFVERLKISAYAANAGSAGLKAFRNFEFGVQAKWEGEVFYSGFGASYNRGTNASNILADCLAGLNLGDWTIDVEATLRKSELAPSVLAGGLLADLWYQFADASQGAGVRVGYLSDVAYTTEIESTIGYLYRFSEGISAKLDYSLVAYATTPAAHYQTYHTGAIGAVFTY